MKYFLISYLLLSPLLLATEFSYTKTLFLLEQVDKPTLVRFKLDKDIYKYTQQNYEDIRITTQKEEIGYFLKKPNPTIENKQTLSTSAYDREKTTLTYIFKEPFLIEEINLHIENRNFETKATLMIDGKIIKSDISIYDYSKETGNRNFSIKIKPLFGKKVVLQYRLKETHIFTAKKQNEHALLKYLNIHSATFINHELPNVAYDTTTISAFDKITKDKNSQYLFDLQNIDTHHIMLNVKNKNYKRDGEAYVSQDNKRWHYLKSFTISASTLTQHKQNTIKIQTRDKYLKLLLHNYNNRSLDIQNITLYTQATYLYFIAEKEKVYTIKFGNDLLKKPFYDLQTLVGNTDKFIEAKAKTIKHHIKLSKKPTFFETYNTILFTLAILLAVAVLLYIAFVLLKKQDN